MQKVKAVKIDGRDKPVTVRELRVKDILGLMGEGDDSGPDITSLAGMKTALDLVADITLEEIKELAPSEIKVIYDAFREVNSVFFEVAGTVGLGKVLDELKQSIVKDFARQFAG